MYRYLSLVERKVTEFCHNVDRRHYLVWLKWLILIAFPDNWWFPWVVNVVMIMMMMMMISTKDMVNWQLLPCLPRWQLSWPGSKSPGSSSRIVYIMLLHPILLAPKVFLDFLRPMITIQSHHILSATKPLNHQNRPQAVSSRSFDLLNSMIYDLKWSEDQSVTFWCRYWSRDRNWDHFGLEYGLETRMGWPLAIASTGKGFDTKERRCVDPLTK